jgi:hypothetical protein
MALYCGRLRSSTGTNDPGEPVGLHRLRQVGDRARRGVQPAVGTLLAVLGPGADLLQVGAALANRLAFAVPATTLLAVVLQSIPSTRSFILPSMDKV